MNQLLVDQEVITRYIGQPSRLPAELRAQVERECGSAPALYALVDLDERLQLSEQWLILGASTLAIARPQATGHRPQEQTWDVHTIARASVRAVRMSPGLSSNTLLLLGAPNEAPLAVLRYTQRQRAAVEAIRFVLDEAIQGRAVATPTDADRTYAQTVARPVRDAQALISRRRGAVVLRLLGYLRPYRKQLTLGMSAAAVITLASLVPPYLAGYVIDKVVRPAQEGTLAHDVATRMAWTAIITMGVLYVLRQISVHVRLRLMSVLGEWVARDLRGELYAHIQRLSLGFFSRKKTGSLITRVTADTDRLWDFLAFGMVDVSLSLVMLIGLSTVLLTLDWRLGLVMTLPVPLMCWLIYWHGERLNRLFIRAWRKWSAVTDVLSDTIPGIRVVKAFNQEAREIDRFGARNDDVTDEFNRIHRMWTTFWPILMFAVRMTILLVWVFAIPRLLGSGPPLSA